MYDIEKKRREAGLYRKGSHSAFVVADAYREGREGVTECICSGDPVYMVLIAANVLMEAGKRLSLPKERVEELLREIRRELESQKDESP